MKKDVKKCSWTFSEAFTPVTKRSQWHNLPTSIHHWRSQRTCSFYQRGKTFDGESGCQPKKTLSKSSSLSFLILCSSLLEWMGEARRRNVISPPSSSVHCIPPSMNPHCPPFLTEIPDLQSLGITTKSDNLWSPSWSVERARDYHWDLSSLHVWNSITIVAI